MRFGLVMQTFSNILGLLMNMFTSSHRKRALVALFFAACVTIPAGSVAEPNAVPKPAWQEVGFLNFKGGVKSFRDAQRAATPNAADWREATLGLALCLHQAQPDTESDKKEAATLYDALITQAADWDLLPVVLLLRARLAERIDYFGDVQDPQLARSLYERIITDYPDHPLSNQAALFRSQQLIFTMDQTVAQEGVDLMEAWLAAHPENELAALHWMLLGAAQQYPLKQPGKAVAAYERAMKAGLPPSVKRDSYYWKLANLAEQANDIDTAAHYYRLIMTEQPRSGFTYESFVQLKELGFTPPPLLDPFTEAPAEKEGP